MTGSRGQGTCDLQQFFVSINFLNPMSVLNLKNKNIEDVLLTLTTGLPLVYCIRVTGACEYTGPN